MRVVRNRREEGYVDDDIDLMLKRHWKRL